MKYLVSNEEDTDSLHALTVDWMRPAEDCQALLGEQWATYSYKKGM